jgi:adenosylmethionine-8-amino-7-oxononanoate aminotransferase
MKNDDVAHKTDLNAALMARSRAAVWHPCTQMKHHEALPIVPIARGEGAWLIDHNGMRYLDAVSSWWVNLFGHANPRINAALKAQLDTLEHAMLAGFTHTPAVELAERLATLSGLGHAFFASDGASAVEIALKMSFHYWRNTGDTRRTKFVSLEGGYHGETLGALAVTDVPIFRSAYQALLQSHLQVAAPTRPLDCATACCDECADDAIIALEQLLAERHHEIAAMIVEPLVQGAAGMRFYPPRYLAAARALTAKYNVHLIADEIMTGFGRTGTFFAWHQVNAAKPDFMCLSKGITGGYLPLSCVLTTEDVYAAFYDDATARGFLHSHSYTGSALACRAALATLDIFDADDVINVNRLKATQMTQAMSAIVQHPRVSGFRQRGMIWAFEVETVRSDFSRAFFSAAMAHGVLLRPIGNTVYFMPPYTVSEAEAAHMIAGTLAAIEAVQ